MGDCRSLESYFFLLLTPQNIGRVYVFGCILLTLTGSLLFYDVCVMSVGWNNEPYNGFLLPSARLVSSRIIRTEDITADTGSSHMLWLWGAYMAHDFTLTPQVSSL